MLQGYRRLVVEFVTVWGRVSLCSGHFKALVCFHSEKGYVVCIFASENTGPTSLLFVFASNSKTSSRVESVCKGWHKQHGISHLNYMDEKLWKFCSVLFERQQVIPLPPHLHTSTSPLFIMARNLPLSRLLAQSLNFLFGCMDIACRSLAVLKENIA